jgi:hypothetical protein
MQQMQEVLAELLKAGYTPPDLVPDSNVHRFNRDATDHKKNAWYVCHVGHSRKGDEFFTVIYGDWREGDYNKHCTEQR